MRIIDSIPHESMSISILKMNDKFLVRFEAGPMEQTFKFEVEEVQSVENLRNRISPEFIEITRKRFNEMFVQLRTASDKA